MRARMIRLLIAVFVALGMLGGATAALADEVYPPEVPPATEEPEVGEEIEVEPEAPAEEVVTPDEVSEVAVGEELAQTGTSVTLLALVGVGLIGLGVVLVSRRRSAGGIA